MSPAATCCSGWLMPVYTRYIGDLCEGDTCKLATSCGSKVMSLCWQFAVVVGYYMCGEM